MRRDNANDTRSAIRRAAARIFAEKGFKAATVREICARADVNIALVSHYFGSKRELYADVCRTLFEDLAAPLATLNVGIDSEAKWRAAVTEWISRTLAIFSANRSPAREAAGIYQHEMTSPSAMMEYIRSEFVHPVFGCLRSLVEMGGPLSEAETFMHINAIWARTSVYALMDDAWLNAARPAGFSRKAWIDEIACDIAQGVFATLRFTPGSQGSA